MVYHGGQFLGGPGQIYVGGKADEVGQMSVDYMSVIEFKNCVKGLEYCSVGDLRYTFDDKDWVGVKALKGDKNIIRLINLMLEENRAMLNIFVEHVVDASEIVESVDPTLRLTATLELESREEYRGTREGDDIESLEDRDSVEGDGVGGDVGYENKGGLKGSHSVKGDWVRVNVCQDEGHEVDGLDLVNKVDDRVADEIIAK